MDLNTTIQLIGHSHKNKEVNNTLRELGFETIPESYNLHEGVPYSVTHKHNILEILLEFTGYKYFLWEYGEPIGYNEKLEHELILKWVVLDCVNLRSSQKKLSLPFPFNLSQSKSEIIEALRNEGYNIQKYPNGKSLFYIKDEKQYTLGFDSNEQIQMIIISLLRLEDKKSNSIGSSLSSQKKNILVKYKERVLKYENAMPQLDWNYQSEMGSKNAEILVSKIFTELQSSLSDLTQKRDPKGIFLAVKDAIVKLNNAQNTGLEIHTDEREILCETIQGLLSATGFDSMNTDITTKWRNW